MMKKNQLSHNLRAYYWSQMDWLALVIVGFIEIWTQYGLDLAQILLLQGIFGLFVMLLEFPSGVLADLTQRKTLLVVSYITMILGLLTYLVANSFLWFAASEILFAVGFAGKSGANTAHIYDTYLERDQRERADEVLTSGNSLRFAGTMVMTAIGGVLATITWWVPIVLASLGYLVTCILYSQAREPERIRVENSSAAIRESLRYLSNPGILKLALILLFVNVFLRISFWDYLPRMELLQVDEIWYGLLLAGANAMAFLTSLALRRYRQLVNFDLVFVAVGILGLVLFLNQSTLVVVLIAILLHQIYRGGSNVIYSIGLNEKVQSDVRASLTSLISAIIQGSYFIAIVVFNLLDLSSLAIHQANAWMGIITGLGIVAISVTERHPHRSSTVQESQIVTGD